MQKKKKSAAQLLRSFLTVSRERHGKWEGLCQVILEINVQRVSLVRESVGCKPRSSADGVHCLERDLGGDTALSRTAGPCTEQKPRQNKSDKGLKVEGTEYSVPNVRAWGKGQVRGDQATLGNRQRLRLTI